MDFRGSGSQETGLTFEENARIKALGYASPAGA